MFVYNFLNKNMNVNIQKTMILKTYKGPNFIAFNISIPLNTCFSSLTICKCIINSRRGFECVLEFIFTEC